MRHRMGCAAQTGLGNPSQPLLKNKWADNEEINNVAKAMMSEAIDLWFKEYEGCDFNIDVGEKHIEVAMGIEPAYQLDPLKIVIINSNIQYSSFTTGIAYGYYGSNIVQKYKRYEEYKNNCKFKRFADKWSAELQKILGSGVNAK